MAMELFSGRGVGLVIFLFLATQVIDSDQAPRDSFKFKNQKRDGEDFARKFDTGRANEPFKFKDQKRGAACDARFSKINSGHTACLTKSAASTDSGVSKQDQKAIVDLHNKERRMVSPAASDMMSMTWDDGVADTAQKWADNCNFAHDTSYNRNDFGRFTVGQNLALGQQTWEAAVLAWASEKQYYDYDLNASTQPGEAVGHYTQVVWAKSVKVGCGFAKCSGKNMYVCNYGPGGNMKGEKPYTRGTSCGACSQSCNDKLCDCGDRVCKNGGTMDPDSCACTCKNNFYEQPDCTLNCGADEASTCSQLKAYCKMAANVPQDCPKSCGMCPAASNA